MKQADIVVIGGGPAGLCAAISAAQSGAGVLIIDKNKNLGGRNNMYVKKGRWN
jgi:sarcosine oxidase subunit alpha